MKTFVRRASGAELSADFMEKETNERTNERIRRVYASLFPFTRQFSYRICEYSLRKGKRQRDGERQRDRERERKFGTLAEI